MFYYVLDRRIIENIIDTCKDLEKVGASWYALEGLGGAG